MSKKKKEMDQLTLDCIAARQAGMTYGKYKAMRYTPTEAPKAKKDEQEPLCAVCGKVIMDYRKNKKYCCPRCYEEAMQAKARERYWRKVEENESGND